jgi:glycosyltransferase involved in cell wall biosynthesis
MMSEATVPQPGILQEHPTLSVCMIVRNEEEALARCLKSVEPVADELIVVDTGSKDNSISIAKDFGAKIFHFEWCDDFAAARNESLKHAIGDWILQIDADEELVSDSISTVRDSIFESSVLCYLIKCDNGPEFKPKTNRFQWFSRLFRNHPWLQFSRPFLESLNTDDLINKEPRWQVKYESSIVIRHYGYDPSRMIQKWDGYIRMMKSYLEENPHDAYVLTHLGDLCGKLGRDDEAEAYLNKSLKLNPDWPETQYSLGLILQKQKKLEAAAKCYEKATAANPNFSEAHVNLGLIYIQKGLLDSAISRLKRAVVLNPNDGHAHFLLAFTYYGKKRYEVAVLHCDRAVKLGYEVPQWFLESLNAHT